MKSLKILIVTLLLSACNEQNTTVEMKPKDMDIIHVEEELKLIEQTRSAFTLSLKQGRYEDINGLVTKDGKSIRAGGIGFEEMFALGKERGKFPYDSIIMTPTETIIMNDSMAYDWGSSKTYYTNKKGEPVELKNSFLVILKKEDGTWKLHREVASSVLE